MRHRYVFAIAALAGCLLVPATAQAAWSSNILGNNVTLTAAGGNSELMKISPVGSFLEHNTLTGLYSSNLDWDTTTPGEQRITDGSAISFTILGGTGDDPVEIDGPNFIASSFSFNGATGTDSLTLDDSSSVTGEDIVVGSSGVTGYGGGGITYSNLSGAGEAVHVVGSSTNDTIELGSGIPPATSVDASQGSDDLKVDDAVSTTGKLDGGSGNQQDTLDYSDWATGVDIEEDPSDNTAFGTATGTGGVRDFEILDGTGQADTLATGPGDSGGSDLNEVNAGGGADTITGGDGRDFIYGGAGADTVSGGASADTIDGGTEDDPQLNGDGGDDTITGGTGNDQIDGGQGQDALNGNDGNDTVKGGAGDDVPTIANNLGGVYGGPGDDTLDGGAGSDYINGCCDVDNDKIVFGSATHAVTVDMTQTNAVVDDGTGGSDDVANVETWVGTSFNDQMTGTGANATFIGMDGADTLTAGGVSYTLIGGNGADTLTGANGADTLLGGPGTDALHGGGSNDMLDGGTGADSLDGGSSDDTVAFQDATGGVNVDLAAPSISDDGTGSADTISTAGSASTIENVTGTPFADVVKGDASTNILHGGDGADQLSTGSAGFDQLFGDAGNDLLKTVNRYPTTTMDCGSDTDELQRDLETYDHLTDVTGCETVKTAADLPFFSGGPSFGNDNDPEFTGGSDTGSTVRIFTTSDCSGSPVATGTAAEFASPGITVHVNDDTVTTFYLDALSADGVSSTCATNSTRTYTEDSTPPNPPTATITPASPANNNHPVITGTAPNDASQVVLSNQTCTSIGPGVSASNYPTTGIGTPFTDVADDSTTTFYLATRDSSGNKSTCTPVTYVEDSTAPPVPVLGSISPSSSNDHPVVTGTTSGDAASVQLFASAGCTGPVAASGTTSAFASGISVPVPENATTGVAARALDLAGNPSSCSNALSYTEDSSGPAVAISAKPKPKSKSTKASFAFSAPDASSYQCQLDARGFVPCTSPTSYSKLRPGAHTFSVKGTDAFGNVGSASTSPWRVLKAKKKKK
jgi:Ca2+-binding RTX toxin-like protein